MYGGVSDHPNHLPHERPLAMPSTSIVSPDPRKKCVLGAQIGAEENKSQVFFF
nr:hypothetical protein Iba_chr09dCG3250 [Ipomoea batatas]